MTCTHYWTVTSACPKCQAEEIERLKAALDEERRSRQQAAQDWLAERAATGRALARAQRLRALARDLVAVVRDSRARRQAAEAERDAAVALLRELADYAPNYGTGYAIDLFFRIDALLKQEGGR